MKQKIIIIFLFVATFTANVLSKEEWQRDPGTC